MRKILPLFWIILVMVWPDRSLLGQMRFVPITDTSNPINTDPLGPAVNNYNGSAWIDFDGDGDLDLYAHIGRLYRNDGGNFVAVTNSPGSGLSNAAVGKGISFGDVDNDGDLDAFVTSTRGSGLYLNNGGTYTRIATGSIGQANAGWAGALGDYDNDGLLDIIIAAPLGFEGISSSNLLFHNDGNAQFTQIDTSVITLQTGPFTVPSWYDYDMDGDIDLFIGSGPATGNAGPDFYYKNMLNETGTAYFRRMTDNFASELRDGQNVNWFDFDNDGDFDFFVTNYGFGNNSIQPNHFYRNDAGTFTKISTGAISSDADVSLGNLWEDFDNDGDLDCFISNENGDSSRYYQNNNDGTFTRIDTLAMSNGTNPRRGATAGDFDQDGDLDLYVYSSFTGVNNFFRNDLTNGNHWINFRLSGKVTNHTAWGAIIRVKATIGGNSRWQTRQMSAQNSFSGHSAELQHFGMADATNVDSVEIRWPSGIRQYVTSLAVNQTVDIIEDTSLSYKPNFKWLSNNTTFVDSSYTTTLFAHANPKAVYRLIQSPSGMTIDSISGLIQWMPNATQTGNQTVRVSAVNSQGTQERQYTLNVIQLVKPQIIPLPDRATMVGMNVSVFAKYVTTPTQPATYQLVQGPAGMTINSIAGHITWKPTSSQLGSHTIKIRSVNSVGSDSITFTIDVKEQPKIYVLQNPVATHTVDLITISEISLRSKPFIQVTQRVFAPGQGPFVVSDSVSPGVYRGSWVFDSTRTYQINATFSDSNGFTGSLQKIFTVAIIAADKPTLIQTMDSRFNVFVPARAIASERFVIIESSQEAGMDFINFGNALELQSQAHIELNAWRNPKIEFETINGWEEIPVERVGRLYRANIKHLGKFRISESTDSGISDKVPHNLSLSQNYPNPFNPTTTIRFDLHQTSDIRLTVYNTLGQRIRLVTQGVFSAGTYRVIWDGRNDQGAAVASGIYIYRLESDGNFFSKRMMLIK
ncbi:MAG TPA: FG-GAP-like repeat-containing protein [bacterium]|nr:FG-GAP-like repeat-containing protein [bacterium]HMW36420.1 FG-GAP-like repeat-containing protein [bacterium]HMZ05190.1 FG-GAP-like repeat-containing protein [bacterium]HNB57146.1 FG-GAP-like repeat-containing protein [bacterium]HND77971.1 FG-GAP-like repeat-containing protein [bacterium]